MRITRFSQTAFINRHSPTIDFSVFAYKNGSNHTQKFKKWISTLKLLFRCQTGNIAVKWLRMGLRAKVYGVRV